MPEFIITAPDGKKYRVTGATAEGAKEAIKKRTQQQEPSVAADVARSIPAGLRSGTEMLMGLPGDVNEMTQSVAGRVARALFGDQRTEDVKNWVPSGLRSEGFTTSTVKEGSEQMFGPTYQSKTTPGRYTKSVFEQVPTAVVGPGGRVAKAMQALLGGVGAEAGGELAEGSDYEAAARAAGGLAGGLAGTRFAARPMPNSRDLAYETNVATLEREGVPMTAGQQTGSKRAQYIESELGGGAFDALIDRQRSVFTDATMRRLGEEGGAALPEDLARTRGRIGGEFDRLSASTAVPFDQQLQNELLNTAVDYQDVAPQVAPAVEGLMNRMGQMAAQNGGMLAGDNYKEMVTRLRELSASADVPQGQAFDAFREALDSAVERNLQGPALDEWRTARRQYANLMTVERAMTGAGAEAATGQIAPTRLRTAITGGGNGPAAIAEGRSTLTDLANAGVGVSKDLPQSGTAPRLAARAIPAAIGAAGTAGMTGGEPFSAALMAALGGVAGPELLGRAVMSGPGQAMLRARLPGHDERALLASILASRQGGMGGP